MSAHGNKVFSRQRGVVMEWIFANCNPSEIWGVQGGLATKILDGRLPLRSPAAQTLRIGLSDRDNREGHR